MNLATPIGFGVCQQQSSQTTLPIERLVEVIGGLDEAWIVAGGRKAVRPSQLPALAVRKLVRIAGDHPAVPPAVDAAGTTAVTLVP